MKSVRSSAAARTRQGPPSGPLPNASYTRDDWDAETFAVFGEGQDPASCPACKRIGFYGPRIDEPDLRYRQCRFCGFTQQIENKSEIYRSCVHGCDAWPKVARAPYVWWVPPNVASYRCAYCGTLAVVSKTEIVRPVDDRQHPWRKVPQGMTRGHYVRFWSRWTVTKGRAFL